MHLEVWAGLWRQDALRVRFLLGVPCNINLPCSFTYCRGKVVAARLTLKSTLGFSEERWYINPREHKQCYKSTKLMWHLFRSKASLLEIRNSLRVFLNFFHYIWLILKYLHLGKFAQNSNLFPLKREKPSKSDIWVKWILVHSTKYIIVFVNWKLQNSNILESMPIMKSNKCMYSMNPSF